MMPRRVVAHMKQQHRAAFGIEQLIVVPDVFS
jgi:hypothetical protein